MRRLAVLLALFCFAATYASAATTIVVTDNGTDTTYTDMPTAEANFVAGDTMDIQAFDGPLPWAGNCPTWVTIKCTAPTPATLQMSNADKANTTFGDLDHTHLENLIIDGLCSLDGSHDGFARAFGGGVASTVTNCTIKNFWWKCVLVTSGDGDVGPTFTNCYIAGAGNAISFDSSFAGQITDKAIINHCTLVSYGSDAPIGLESSYAGMDLKQVFSLRNSILSGRGSAVGINYHGGTLTDATTQVDEDYNLFDAWWHPLYSEGNDAGCSGPVGAHSVAFDFRSAPDFYNNYANGDYTLAKVDGNPCVGTGENGSNIGADNPPPPLVPNTIVLRHGSTNTTEASLAAALAAAVQGDTVDITAGNTPIDGGGGFQLIGVNLVCSAPNPATINFAGAEDPNVYANMTYMLTQGTVTLRNIDFVGNNHAGAYGVIAFDKITIDRCSFSKFAGGGIWILNVDSFDAAGKGYLSKTLNANITNTYSVDNGSAVQVSSVAVGGGACLPCTINIDHCTLANQYNPLFFDTTYLKGEPTHDFSPLHLTNTLLYSDPAKSGPGIFVQDAGASDGVSPAAVNWHEHHNAFVGVTESADAIIQYQVASPGTQTALDSTDVYQGYPANNPFVDSASGNYKLNATSGLQGKGTNGTDIGVVEQTVPVELSAFSVE